MEPWKKVLYEVDVSSLKVTELYKDGNNVRWRKIEHYGTGENPQYATLPNAHGKGLYSGHGVLVYSINGEATQEALQKFDVAAGLLGEWDGKYWKVLWRNQKLDTSYYMG